MSPWQGNYAYLGAWQGEGGCQTGGVYIFDIADPAAPRQVGFVPTGPGSFVGEGVQVVSLKTAAFRGDVLLFSNEICGAPGATGGVTMIDVTDPTAPTVLAAGFGDTDGTAPRAHTVHSVFAWQDGPKAYATLVDNEDAADVDIFDVTDPRNPVMVAEYDLAERFPQILQPDVPNLNQVFLHDLVVKKIKGRQVMLASYWDAGYVKLDVTDPRNVTYLGDTDFTNPDPELLAQTGTRELPEGNAHYADFTKDNRYIVAADEDFSPYGLAGSTDDGTTFAAQVGSATKPITPDAPLAGTAVYVGRACTSDPAVPTPPATGGPYLAVAERGGCAFTEKVANVEAVTANGGYAGTVVFNIATPAGCGSFGMSVQGNKPAVSVDRGTGYSCSTSPTTRRRAGREMGNSPRSPWVRPGISSLSVRISMGGVMCTCTATATARWPSSTPSRSPRRWTSASPPASAPCPCTRWRPAPRTIRWCTSPTMRADSAS